MSTPLTWVRDRPWVGDLGLAVLVAVPIGASSLSLLADASTGTVVRLVIVLAVLHLTLAFRRVAPLVSFGVAAAAELVLLLSPQLSVRTGGTVTGYAPILLPTSVVFALSLYAACAYGPRLAVSMSLGVGLAGATATSVRLGIDHDVVDGAATVSFAAAGIVVAILAAWTLGMFRRLQLAQVVEQRELRAEEAVRDERARVARELHDVVAHSLAVVVRQADAGRFVAASDPAAAVRVFETVAETGRAALADMRSLLGVLRTDSLTGDPTPTTADIDALVDRVRAGGQAVSLTRTGDPVTLPAAAELAAYRLVQEGLTNVVKHAGRDAVAEVTLAHDRGGLDVCVRDDGGRDARPAVAAGGYGLAGLRERIALVGGELHAGPDGRGFVLRARIPVATP